MKSLVRLSRVLLQECGSQCGVETEMDCSVLVKRAEQEGDSFLTITLPAFAQSLERGLARGRVVKEDFQGWRKDPSGLPRFLGGFLRLVFHRDGTVNSACSPDVVFLLRQFLLVRKKVWAIASDKRQRSALSSYIRCEEEIDDDFHCEHFRKTSAVVLSTVLAGERGIFDPDTIVGRHGPGATADQKLTNSRFRFDTWTQRLESVFPVGLHAFSTELAYYSEDRCINFLDEDNETPVKVIFVPKTMKTPRVIAIEPSWNQFIQQGLMRWLVPLIEGSSLTSGRVNFTDQSINQRLALSSSVDGRFATIDMKEASDRVSLRHVEHMFGWNPGLLQAILACRSRTAELPNGQVVTLKKFSSMGSALCFPIEAMAFFIGIISTRLQSRNLPVNIRNVRKYAKDIYVFGDDIIVPSDETPRIIEGLESLGFLVNRSKSFWTGKFRESCGVDAYDGVDVTPSYCRFDLDPTDPASIVSWVAFGNQLYAKGLWATARYVREEVERLPSPAGRRSSIGPLPFVSENSGAIGWRNFSNSVTFSRWNKHLHRFETRAFVATTSRRSDPLDGDPALVKCLRLTGSDFPVDPKHLLESVRPWSLKLKARWVPSI